MFKLFTHIKNSKKISLRHRLVDVRRFADFCAIFASGIFSVFLSRDVSFSSLGILKLALIAMVQFLTFMPVVFRERFWRNVSAYEAVKFFHASAIFASCLATINIFFLHIPGFSSWIVIDTVMVLFALCGMRLTRRILFEVRSSRINQAAGRATLIYGTGVAAQSLATRFAGDPSLGIRLVGFVDDDRAQVGRVEKGVRVLGTSADLPTLLKTHGIQQLILAKTMKDGERLKSILQEAHGLKVQTRILSDLGLKKNEGDGAELFRDVNLQDLLQRPRVQVDLTPTAKMIADGVVLVSGAGGSIGSELIRQIAKMEPEKIVALDHSEFNLYEIESEMKKSGYAGTFIPILSDLKEPKLLARIMDTYRPQFVFHAAAYKHVHLVEMNASAAIINNIQTLKNLIECSIRSGVENFVLISTDKAVNPKGLMGCTKRACELMISQAAAQSEKRFCSVRFGNVLGSSGSFIPLLKRQIQHGGPVTITHPDMERYFMLIPEAVSLVLKAASFSAPGDINVLRMGNSIKILDVAKSIMTLLGKADGEIPFIFTGIRPGEKLREELYLRGDELSTTHPDILVLPRGAGAGAGEAVSALIEQILSLAENDDASAVSLLKGLVETSDEGLLAVDGKESLLENVNGNPNWVA